MTGTWPELRVADWADTRDTVQLWTQIVGKVRLALAPPENEWWQVALYVTASGLTTSLMPYRDHGLEIEFDFVDHELIGRTTLGARASFPLAPMSVATFYERFRQLLAGLDVDVPIMPRPVELAVAIPFARDETHRSYDAAAMHRFWLSLVDAHRVFSRFRGEFRGSELRARGPRAAPGFSRRGRPLRGRPPFSGSHRRPTVPEMRRCFRLVVMSG